MEQEEDVPKEAMMDEQHLCSNQHPKQLQQPYQIDLEQSANHSNVIQQLQPNCNIHHPTQKNGISEIQCNNNKLAQKASPDSEESPPKVRGRGRRKNARVKKVDEEDRIQQGQICQLFIELIDVINRCYTGISLPREPIVLIEDAHEIRENEEEKNDKRQKVYTSARLKRKTVHKYSQPDREVQKIKQPKTKRQNSRKALPMPTIANSIDQTNKTDKEPEPGALSVQEILNRKLQEQKEIEKKQVFSNYEQIMRYEIIKEEVKEKEDLEGMQLCEKEKSEREKSESLRKLSIEKCLQVSVTPSKQKAN